jgi:hypothetical protein
VLNQLAQANTRLERTRHELAPSLICVGEPLKRSVVHLSSGNSSLASQSIPTWNRIIDWLKEMGTIR